IAQLALVCEADKRGRLGSENADYPQGRELVRLHASAMAVNARDIDDETISGPAMGEALRKSRISAIGKARSTL
ncbi:MAG TPA: multifunctional CCA tRNA nucleotidyl transferase/2'3'-cyclic phosphodiesterase/2'nucleotidase/phosphatase, partial [Pseudoxanthomonas sp.]|nr:multifunctional CCA tRNA nucleotidyl transferase/2'3'-cyclic phosphodiesterase/2'nucleotidase/phosphatase [Pseudoxanthomonas sp.]